MKRLIANIIVIISIAVLPWWVSMLLILLMLFYFNFIEMIIYGVMLDSLYGRQGSIISEHLFFIAGVTIYALFILIKPYLRNVN